MEKESDRDPIDMEMMEVGGEGREREKEGRRRGTERREGGGRKEEDGGPQREGLEHITEMREVHVDNSNSQCSQVEWRVWPVRHLWYQQSQEGRELERGGEVRQAPS